MRIKSLAVAIFIIIYCCIASCFYATAPETPKPEQFKPGMKPVPFDWNALIYYVTAIAAAIRWGIVEWKHRALIKAGKKDDNRDGKED